MWLYRKFPFLCGNSWELIFLECLLFKIHVKVTLLVSVIHYTRSIQGNMHILNLNFRMHFDRPLKSILHFLLHYFIIDSKNYAKNKEQKQSRQAVLYCFQHKYIQLNCLNHEKNEHIWETYTCKWFIVSREAYLHL